MRFRSLFTFLSLSAFLCVLSACGPAANGSNGTNSAAPGPTQSSTAPNSPTPVPSQQAAPPQNTPAPTTMPSTAGDKVTLTLNKRNYGTNERISVTITNGLSKAITTMDHQSACTVVTLQMQVNNQWQTRSPCLLKTATRLITILAGSSITQSLTPGVTNSWPNGLYRLVFNYNVGEHLVPTGGDVPAFASILSSTFTIS